MSHDFLPELPVSYSWLLFDEDGQDCTTDYYAECAAQEAQIVRESTSGPKPVLTVKRTGDYGFWGPGTAKEPGLRQWEVEGPSPAQIFEWEQFVTLSQVAQRMRAAYS